MKVNLLVIAVFCLSLANEVLAQTNPPVLVFSDDFTGSNAVWKFVQGGTEDNATAIAASYGKIEDGVLKLKANVDCGWDFLNSWAILDMPLPDEYQIEYRANKLQWCGSLDTSVSSAFALTSNTASPIEIPRPHYQFFEAGSVFGQLRIRTNAFDLDIQPADSSFAYGSWSNYRIIKRHNSLRVYVDDVLKWSYDGTVLDGGIFHLNTAGAGQPLKLTTSNSTI